MKFEKIVVAVAAFSIIFVLTHNSVAQSLGTSKNLVAGNAKKTSSKKSKKKSRKLKAATATPAKTEQKMSVMSAATVDETRYARPLSPNLRVQTPVKKVIAETPKSPFSGGVELTLGKDSNLNPSDPTAHDTFFQIAPTLNFAKGGWGAAFGASTRDYSNSNFSNLYKSSEFNGAGSYEGKITNEFVSKSALSGVYHDERTTNDMTGADLDGVDYGMQTRYAEAKFEQSLSYNLPIFKTTIGGYYTHHNALSKETDQADPAVGERIFERDFNELGAKARFTLSAASFLDISLAPLVAQTKYSELLARLAGGQKAGIALAAGVPTENLLKNELGLDIAFKFGKSNITPKFLIGQVADQGFSARDNGYYGMGITSSIMLYEPRKITLAPTFMYKKASYDNWTNGVNYVGGVAPTPLSFREDYTSSGGITGSMLIAENFSVGLGYSIDVARSNLVDPLLNFRKEVVSSSFTFLF